MTAQGPTAFETSIGFDSAVALAHLRGRDPALARLIDAVGPYRLRPEPAASLFLALAEAIVYQQLTAKAAGTIFARVRALFPGTAEAPTPRELLRVSDAALRAAGLSGSKLPRCATLPAGRTAGSCRPGARFRAWRTKRSSRD